VWVIKKKERKKKKKKKKNRKQLYIYFADVLSQGPWKLLDELELQDLASRLPQTILHSRANTVAM